MPAETEVKNTPAAPAPKATIDFADIAKGMPADDAPAPKFDENKPAEPVKTEQPPAAAKPAETKTDTKPGDTTEGEGAGTPFEKGFRQLTQRSAALRAREDAVKHVEPLSKALSPVQAAAFVKALQSGDALAAMNAVGFSYADIAARVAGAPAKPATPPAAKPPEQKGEPEVEEDPELLEMKTDWKARRAQQQEQVIINGIKGVVTQAAAKFKTIAALEDFSGVNSVLTEMYREGGGAFPSNDALENITLAAEEYERRLASGEVPLTRKQWEKLQGLTAAPTSGSTQKPAATRVGPGNAQVSSGSTQTLTNNAGAPPPAPAATRPDPTKMYSDIAAGMP